MILRQTSFWSLCALITAQFIITLFVGCKSHKHLVSAGSNPKERLDSAAEAEVLSRLEGRSLGNQFLQLKGKVSLTVQGKDQREFNIQVRIQPNEVIWVSATAFLGTEIGRFMITPNQFQLINRMDGQFLQSPLESFLALVGLDQNMSSQQGFELIQHILTAFPVTRMENPSTFWEVHKVNNGYYLSDKGSHSASGATIEQYVNSSDMNLNTLKWTQNSSRKLHVIYDWKDRISSEVGAFSQPKVWTMQLDQEGISWQCTFHIDRVQVLEEMSFPFSIPGNYTKIDSFRIQ